MKNISERMIKCFVSNKIPWNYPSNWTDDEVDSQTEGEELEKARAIRMQEAKVKPVQYLPTDTETEVRIIIIIILIANSNSKHIFYIVHNAHIHNK